MDPDVRHAAFEAVAADADPAAPGNTAVDLVVDLAGERPSQTSHGLRPDRTSRWLAGGMVGVALLMIAIVTAVRSSSDDDAPVEREVPLLEAQLAEPLSFAVISLERVRLEWMTTEILRTLDRPIASVSKRPAKAPTHASTAVPPTSASGSSRKPAPKLSDLPAPNLATPDAAAPDSAASDVAPPKSDDTAPDAAPPAETPAADAPPPGALPGVDAPEPEVVDDEV